MKERERREEGEGRGEKRKGEMKGRERQIRGRHCSGFDSAGVSGSEGKPENGGSGMRSKEWKK